MIKDGVLVVLLRSTQITNPCVTFAAVFLISFGFSFFHEIQRGYSSRMKMESSQVEKETTSSVVVSYAPAGDGVNVAERVLQQLQSLKFRDAAPAISKLSADSGR